MKRFIFILVVFFFCIFLFQQCKKEGKCLGIFKFTEVGRKIIPYKGGESIAFVDSLGDTINYIVENLEYNLVSGNESGSNDYYLYEVCTVLPFNLKLGFRNPSESTFIISVMSFTLSNHPEIKADFSGEWIYNLGQLFQKQSEWWSGITYYDSLVIVNKKFYSIYELEGWAESDDSTEVYKNMYYSIQHGIVGIKTTKGLGVGRTWCLQ